MTVTEWSVLSVVAAFLIRYLWKCHVLCRGTGSELKALQPGFAQDIRQRAARGEDPDWLRYSEESDRQHEDNCERIRNYATTALATGIGGTMFMLLLHLLWPSPESTDAISSLLQEMGIALVASVLGVTCNLVILLKFLPDASDRFRSEREGLIEALRNTSEENPPLTPDTQLNDTVGRKLERFLENTASNFPGVIAGFRESVSSLSDVATAFESSAGKVESAIEVLSSSTMELKALPANLGEELARARQGWVDDHREDQAQYLKAFRETLADEVEAVRKTLAQLREWQVSGAEAEARWREQRSVEESKYRSALVEVVSTATAEQSATVRETLSALEGWQIRRGEAEKQWHKERAEEEDRQRDAVFGLVSAATVQQNEATRQTLSALEEWQAQRTAAEERWRAQLAADQEKLRKSLREVVNSTGDVAEAAEGLPQAFRKEIGRTSDTLGKRFGLEARQQVADVIDATQRANEELRRHLEGHAQLAADQEKLRKSLREVVNSTGDVAEAAEGLPQAFRKEIGRTSDTLGKRFGLEARQQVADVIDATQRANEELRRHLEGHVRQLLNEMGDIVQQGLKPTEEGISRIGRNLETAGEELRRSIKEFADHGDGFRASLHGAARQIGKSSDQLAGVHERTRASISEIQEEYRVMHRTLGESIEKIESLLKELSIVQGRSRKRGWLTRIFRIGRRGGDRRRAG